MAAVLLLGRTQMQFCWIRVSTFDTLPYLFAMNPKSFPPRTPNRGWSKNVNTLIGNYQIKEKGNWPWVAASCRAPSPLTQN